MTDLLNDSTILIADDDPTACGLLEELLSDTGAETIIAHSGSAAIDILNATTPDLAILDVRMPEPGGMAILQHIRSQGKNIPVLIVTGFGSSRVAIESTYHGAFDYLTKPLTRDALLPIIKQALAQQRRSRQLSPPLQHTLPSDPHELIIGQSDVMQQVYKLIGRVADSDATVLISGESGTGKELVARILHQTSPRREYPFVALNCAALSENLLESDLFGHEKGAFTGAVARRKGRFEQADNGTIFLDEIGEISPSMQKKLLRVLQERTFERVGGNLSLQVDVRVLTATNRDLWHEVLAGRFREDLYYRLRVINLHLPPLRERRDDIPLLVEHFVTRYRKRHNREHVQISETTLQHLMDHEWPGNVRQLENTIERAVVLSQGGVILPEHLGGETAPHSLFETAVADLVRQGYYLDTLLQMTRQCALQAALRHHTGNQLAAERALGIAPGTSKE